MKIFISWSGPLSQELGEALKDWLPGVIQMVKPYFTPADIEKGARWTSEISSQLESSHMGIFCLTRDNVNSPWMTFEAGALSKSIDKSRVCPILFQLQNSDVTGPLSQFQATQFNQTEMYKLCSTINRALEDTKLSETTLKSAFEKWWPDLENRVSAAYANNAFSDKNPVRSDHELLGEILELTRSVAKNMDTVSPMNPIVIMELVDSYFELYSTIREDAPWSFGIAMKHMKVLSGTIRTILVRSRLLTPEISAKFKELSFEKEIASDDIPF